MLNILMIADSAAAGGAERVILDLLKANNEHQLCKIHLCLSNLDGRLLKDFKKQTNIEKLTLTSQVHKVFQIGKNLSHLCKKFQIHAIISHTSPVSKAVLRAAFFYKLPPIFPIEHTEINRQIKHTSSTWKYMTRLSSTRLYYKKAHAVFADSSFIKEELVSLKILEEKKVSVVHCPVNTSRITDRISTKNSRFFKIILAGRLEEVKNFKMIIDAIEIIENSKDKVNLNCTISVDIYGDGPKRSSLKKRIFEKGLAPKIKIHPFTQDLLNRMKESDLLVSTSKFEGLGNVMLEGIACGIPIIATKTGGSMEIKKHSSAIALVNSESPDELAELILNQILTRQLKVTDKDYSFVKNLSPKNILLKYVSEINRFINE